MRRNGAKWRVTTDRKAYTELTDDSRVALYQSLLAKSDNGVLPRGSIRNVAIKCNVYPRTAARIWNNRKGDSAVEVVESIRSRRKGNCGPRKINAYYKKP